MSKPPPFMGVYWSYTLAPSVTASAAVRYANTVHLTPGLDATAAKVLAVVLICFASTLLLCVLLRMAYHEFQVLTGKATWSDVLYTGFQAKEKSEAVVATSPAP